MLFTDGEVVIPVEDERYAQKYGLHKKIDVDELANMFIEWYAEPYEYAEDGDKVSELASDYVECIRFWLRNDTDIRLTFARSAINELWEIIAGKIEQDSRFKKVTTFVYA